MGWAWAATGRGDTLVLGAGEWALPRGNWERVAELLALAGVEGHLPDREGEVTLVLATGPSQEAPVDAAALEQGFRVQPAEVSVKPPAGPGRGEERAVSPCRAPLPPASRGAQDLTSPSWGLPERKGVQGMRCAGQSGRAKNSGAEASTRGARRAQAASQPWRSWCWGCHSTGPGGSQQGGDRKGRGRPLGGTHCTSRFRAERRDAKQGGSGGGDGAHFPHGCHQRL